jgi:hypothetical protein
MKATFSMNNVRSSLPALSVMLLMAFAVPSYANVIQTATGTATCSSYSLEFTGIDLSPSVTYSVDFSFTLTPAGGPAITITGSVSIPAMTTGPFDVKTTGSFAALTQTYTITSSSATLFAGSTQENTVSIMFTSTMLACTPPSPVTHSQAATIGFWHNANGQAVINSFNGGSSSTALGNWLSSNFPNLFGGFAGQTNAQVAADFLTAFSVTTVQGNTYTQAFSMALSIYASTPTLGFNTKAASFGFSGVSLGDATYNVGNNGAAFGVANDTTLTVFQVLMIANANYTPATGLFYGGNPTLTSELNNVLNGILQKGDIA